MASIAIAPSTGVVTLVPRWSIGSNLAGLHLMAQDLSLGGGANEFYSLKSTPIPLGGDVAAFTIYLAASGAATNHADVGSKLTPNSYSALTSADPDLGYGSVELYFIHHKTDGDYFTHLVPSSGTASAVTDLKPMSGPGGPATGGASGYFGLTFSAANLGYGLNMMYYLRTDAVTGNTRFGTLDPALAGASADKFDFGMGGYNALAFTGTDVGFGLNQMYFQRLDPITGYTIFGTLDPTSGRLADIANLGSVYSTLTFVPGDVGFGTGNFYTAGAVNAQWQSVSFAAIADRAISAGSFTVTPSASSTLPIVLTVVTGSIGNASISSPVAGVFTVTPTAPGLITLQATQAGQLGSFEYNMLRQSFTATGVATLVITTQPTPQSAVIGATASFSAVASGTSSVSYQWRKAGIDIASATAATLSLTDVQASDAGSYDVVVTNASGSIMSNAVLLSVTASAPVITNSSLTAAATVGSTFSFSITASNTATSFSASPLPPGLSVDAATGVMSGTPTAAGTTAVLLGATNATGTGNATLTITVAPAPVTPIVTSPSNVATVAGSPSTVVVVATDSPTGFSATGLPPGMSIDSSTGTITGTPTTAGTWVVTVIVTNASGSTNFALTIAVAPKPSSRIVNFSARAMSGAGDQTLIVGFVTDGDNKHLLVRGIGPGLTTQGVVNALADPMLTLFNGNTPTAVNDNWQTPMAQPTGSPEAADGAVIASTAARVGAFALANGSLDSALIMTVNHGPHTTALLRPNSTSGVALAEMYDLDGNGGARLVNVSARMNVTSGEGTLIAGFVIAGNAPKTLLIRGVGPTLSVFGVTGVLVDPMIVLYAGGTVIASNDNWETGSSTAAQLIATSARLGAYPLAAGTKDAALLVTLQPGVYTVHVTGATGAPGVALIEVFDAD